MGRAMPGGANLMSGLSATAQPVEAAREGILFVGDKFTFPDVVLRLVENEIDGISVHRVESTAFQSQPKDGGPRLVIFGESCAAKIVDRRSLLEELCAVSLPVVAFRNSDLARRIWQQQHARNDEIMFRYLPLDMPPDAMIALLRVLLTGEIVFPYAMLSAFRLGESPQHDTSAIGDGVMCEILTPRENEVLQLAAQGKRNKAIAHHLGVSEHTVKLHIHHVIVKLGVANRIEAANYYTSLQGRG